MDDGEPTEDESPSVVVTVKFRDGSTKVLVVPDRDAESIHAEIDDGFVQQSYFMFTLKDEVEYVNYAEVVSIRVQDA